MSSLEIEVVGVRIPLAVLEVSLEANEVESPTRRCAGESFISGSEIAMGEREIRRIARRLDVK